MEPMPPEVNVVSAAEDYAQSRLHAVPSNLKLEIEVAFIAGVEFAETRAQLWQEAEHLTTWGE